MAGIDGKKLAEHGVRYAVYAWVATLMCEHELTVEEAVLSDPDGLSELGPDQVAYLEELLG